MLGAALAIAAGATLAVVSYEEAPEPTVAAEAPEPTVAAEEPQGPVEEPVLKRRAPKEAQRAPKEVQRAPREAQRMPEARPPEPTGEEEQEVLPVANSDWPEPSSAETAGADGPRYFPPRQDSVLTLTVDALGLHDVPVLDSDSEAVLDGGVIHIPQTPMPWEDREQKNVYLAGHRLGYPGTGSRLIFYNLDKLQGGDVITLKDRSGTVYRYRVTEMFQVDPSDDWVMDTVLDRDIVTLQTCAPIPTFEKRLIVRADRIKATASLG